MNTLEDVKKISEIAYHYLKELDPTIEDGTSQLDDGIVVKIKSYDTKLRSESLFESHIKYIDIQYMIQGEEIITIAPTENLSICTEYDADKDITFYSSNNQGTDCLLKERQAMIIYPGEGHMPGIAVDAVKHIKKAIIKVPFERS